MLLKTGATWQPAGSLKCVALIGQPSPCRERQEKADAKRRAAAQGHWRSLLRSVFARLRVRAAYAEEARAAGAVEPSQAAASAPGELLLPRRTWSECDHRPEMCCYRTALPGAHRRFVQVASIAARGVRTAFVL